MRFVLPSFTLVIFISAIGLTTCKNLEVPQFVLGKFTFIAEKIISVTGDKITINKPGDPLDGFVLTVPGGAYTGERKFSISHAPIKEHNFGPDFEPLSPLIRIDNGGEFSEEIMTVTVPVDVPEDAFATAFIIHEHGDLEALPMVSQDEHSVTFLTRHFTDVVVASLIKNKKELYSSYATAFTPGIDDWEMQNPSTFVAKGGQCSGQSISMMWYFIERKKRPLFGLFGEKNPPKFWQDDVLPVKLCAAIQREDYLKRFDNPDLEKYKKAQLKKSDIYTLAQFVAAFKANKKDGKKPRPQFLMISNDNKDAHAVVVYKVDKGCLYVADPNYPGSETQVIEFDQDTKKYRHYASRGITYNNFAFLGEWALISFESVASHWKEFEKGTVGKELFPEYSLAAKNDQGEVVDIADDFTNPTNGKLEMRVNSSGDDLLALNAYDAAGNPLPVEIYTVSIPAGTGRIGIEALIEGRWAGFHWITLAGSDELPEVKQPETGKGKMRMNLKVDGVVAAIDSATFEIDFSISLYGAGPRLPEGTYWTERTVSVHAGGFNGPGTYSLDENGNGTNFWQYGSYSLDKTNPGKITIHQFNNGKLSGEFFFYVADSYGKRKYIQGDFSN